MNFNFNGKELCIQETFLLGFQSRRDLRFRGDDGKEHSFGSSLSFSSSSSSSSSSASDDDLEFCSSCEYGKMSI